MVDQCATSKRYRLSLDFFALAAKAGQAGNLRDVVRPSLLRLSASLGDSLFLLARSGFDAVCLDRSEGPYPIRTFTGDIGGRVALGVGQGSLAILAFLPEEERDEVIRYNLPRLKDFHHYDEVLLRAEIDNVRSLGYAGRNTGVLDGMAGLAVPILDRNGHAVAALSVATISDRLGPNRMPTVVALLKREATAIGERINPSTRCCAGPRMCLVEVPDSGRRDLSGGNCLAQHLKAGATIGERACPRTPAQPVPSIALPASGEPIQPPRPRPGLHPGIHRSGAATVGHKYRSSPTARRGYLAR